MFAFRYSPTPLMRFYFAVPLSISAAGYAKNLRKLLAVLALFAGVVCAPQAQAMSPTEAAMIDSAAHKGSASAQVLLAVVYLNGMAGYPKNEALAAHWFERAAELGNDYAQKIIGDLYAEGRGVNRDPKLAADWREKAANRGNVQAQFLLGKMYYDGVGVAHDTVKADYWLSRAATEGDSAEAQFWLAKLRQVGSGSSGTSASGDNLLAQSAERGYDDAVQLVRLLKEFGYGVSESLYKRPPDLAKLAADGDADAQYQLGKRHETGSGGYPLDGVRAVEWYKRAAQSHHLSAMRHLLKIYEQGLGSVAADTAQATYWREQIAAAPSDGSVTQSDATTGLGDMALLYALGNDIGSFVVSTLMIAAYQLFLLRKTRRNPAYTVQSVNILARAAWVENIMKDGNLGVLAVQTLRNSTMAATFLASTAVLLIIGVLTLSGQGDKLGSTWQALNQHGSMHAGLWIGKLLFLLVDLFIAFFSFAMSVRIYNHVGYMINVPLSLGHRVLTPKHVAAYLNSGGRFYSIGMRAYYFSVPMVFWLFGPHFMLIATVVLILFLYRLDRAPQPLVDEFDSLRLAAV
jgi:TPR repeat protein/uncharacterized membrane protein